MSRILHSRFFRCLVCFVLICCILVASSPFRVQATSAGLAGVITGAASVSVSAPMVIGATLIALGLHAGINGTAGLEAVVDSAVSHLESAGEFIKDGAVELLRTVDETGTAAYYVAGEIMSDLWSWCVDDSVVSFDRVFNFSINHTYSFLTSTYSLSSSVPFDVLVVYSPTGRFGQYEFVVYAFSHSQFTLNWNANSSASYQVGPYYICSFLEGSTTKDTVLSFPCCQIQVDDVNVSSTSPFESEILPEVISTHDLTLGHLPSSDTTLDETTVVTFHPYLADVQRFKRSGGSGGSGDGDDKTKWYLRLALGATTAAVMATTQQQQIENPSVDIEEITWGVQFDVTETTDPDDENKKVHLLTPQIGTGTDPGTGTNPDTGDGSGDNTGSDTGTDTGNSSNTGSSWKPPSDHSQFALTDLSKFFPFCIPFDLFDFFTLLNADPVAPSFSWQIQDLSGQTYALTVDLSQWDSVAQLFRRLQLFLFVCGLAAASRKYIKW